MIKTVKTEAAAREFINNCQQNCGFVCFYPTRSGPSELSKAHMVELSIKYPSVPVIIVEPDECIELANEAGVSDFPTLLFYDSGKVIDQLVSDSKELTEEFFTKYRGIATEWAARKPKWFTPYKPEWQTPKPNQVPGQETLLKPQFAKTETPIMKLFSQIFKDKFKIPEE